jgi:hypothetical protein
MLCIVWCVVLQNSADPKFSTAIPQLWQVRDLLLHYTEFWLILVTYKTVTILEQFWIFQEAKKMQEHNCIVNSYRRNYSSLFSSKPPPSILPIFEAIFTIHVTQDCVYIIEIYKTLWDNNNMHIHWLTSKYLVILNDQYPDTISVPTGHLVYNRVKKKKRRDPEISVGTNNDFCCKFYFILMTSNLL